MKILFINSCVRAESRTRRLADAVLKQISTEQDEIVELNLEKENIQPLNSVTLAKRDQLIANGDYSDDMFCYARQLAEADKIVIAAPLWDMSYPASLKAYIEATMVTGLVFRYGPDGMPVSLCKADRMIYVSSAGGPVFPPHYGYDYIKMISEFFWGIQDNTMILAAMLDVEGADVEQVLADKMEEIKKLKP